MPNIQTDERFDIDLSREQLGQTTKKFADALKEDLREGLHQHYNQTIIDLVQQAFLHGFNSAVNAMRNQKPERFEDSMEVKDGY